MENKINWETFKTKFHPSWWKDLEPFFTSEEAYNLLTKLTEEAKKGNKILPSKDLIFRTFKEVDLDKMSVVFVGLSPYFTPNVPDGLSFSCGLTGVEQPSLKILLDCLENDLGYKDERNPDLTRWSEQNILLLNASLTTLLGDAKTHLPLWRPFMEYLWKSVFSKREILFVYFGKDCQELMQFETKDKHKHYLCNHPSYYARNSSEMTERPFSWINERLKEIGKSPIKWQEYAQDLPWSEEPKKIYEEFI